MNKKRAVILVSIIYCLTSLLPMPSTFAKGISEERSLIVRVTNAQTTNGQIEVEGEITTDGEIEIDKSQVQELIKSAEVLLESAVVGTTPGCYNVLDKDQFQISIHKAKEDLAQAQSQKEVDQVGAVLQDATKRFKASIILKIGDINADGKVDVVDLGIVSYYFKQEAIGDTCCRQCKRADIDGNGIIDMIDLSRVATKIFEEE